MNPGERISFLVSLLENGSGKIFAERCGIPPASLSRIRNGKYSPTPYYARILKAYPRVRVEWLMNESGEPTYDEKDKNELVAQIEALRADVKTLTDAVNELKQLVRACIH